MEGIYRVSQKERYLPIYIELSLANVCRLFKTTDFRDTAVFEYILERIEHIVYYCDGICGDREERSVALLMISELDLGVFQR